MPSCHHCLGLPLPLHCLHCFHHLHRLRRLHRCLRLLVLHHLHRLHGLHGCHFEELRAANSGGGALKPEPKSLRMFYHIHAVLSCVCICICMCVCMCACACVLVLVSCVCSSVFTALQHICCCSRIDLTFEFWTAYKLHIHDEFEELYVHSCTYIISADPSGAIGLWGRV